MKKAIAVLFLSASLILCGCSNGKEESKDERFVVEYKQSESFSSISIIRDTQTGVAYMFVHSGYAGGLTQLVEVDE